MANGSASPAAAAVPAAGPRRRGHEASRTRLRLHRFPNDGIRIDPHMIRRVTSYDGALLEEAHPEVHDVVSPDVARTMTAMLEEVIRFGTGVQAKALGRPAAGKTGTTQDYTDAWFVGYTPQLTRRRVGGLDDKQISLGKKNRRTRRTSHLARIHAGGRRRNAPNGFHHVVPLEQQAGGTTSTWTRRITLPGRRAPAPKENLQPLRRQRRLRRASTTGVSPHFR